MRKVIYPKDYDHSNRTAQIGISSLVHDDNVYSNSLTKSNILNDYFAPAFTKEDTTLIPSLSC